MWDEAGRGLPESARHDAGHSDAVSGQESLTEAQIRALREQYSESVRPATEFQGGYWSEGSGPVFYRARLPSGVLAWIECVSQEEAVQEAWYHYQSGEAEPVDVVTSDPERRNVTTLFAYSRLMEAVQERQEDEIE